MKYKTIGDLVNKPEHYNQGSIECIDAIEAMLSKEEFIGYEKTLDLLKQLKQDPENIYKFLPEESKQCFKKYLNLNSKGNI